MYRELDIEKKNSAHIVSQLSLINMLKYIV